MAMETQVSGPVKIVPGMGLRRLLKEVASKMGMSTEEFEALFCGPREKKEEQGKYEEVLLRGLDALEMKVKEGR